MNKITVDVWEANYGHVEIDLDELKKEYGIDNPSDDDIEDAAMALYNKGMVVWTNSEVCDLSIVR